MKINLKDIQAKLVKRGREQFYDQGLADELSSLDPAIEGDAFIWESAQGDTTDEDFVSHKNKVRNRVNSMAKNMALDVTIYWTDEGECVVALVKAKTKGKRKA